jgi:hypothetical protein
VSAPIDAVDLRLIITMITMITTNTITAMITRAMILAADVDAAAESTEDEAEHAMGVVVPSGFCKKQLEQFAFILDFTTTD